MKIIEQTLTRMVLRYLPLNDWLGILVIIVMAIYLMSQLHREPLYGLLCLIGILVAIYWGTVQIKIITCLVEQPTKTIKIIKHSLLGTPIQEQHKFAEIFQVEVREKRLKNGKCYQLYLLLSSGKTIFLGKQIPILGFNSSHYIRDVSSNLAQFIDCSYSFMPAPSFWKF
jgi:hypothetical protein